MQTKHLLGTVAALALLGSAAIAQDTVVEDAAEATGDAIGDAAEATGDAVEGTGEAIAGAGERIEMPNDGRYTIQTDDAGAPMMNDAGEPVVLDAEGAEVDPSDYRIEGDDEIILLVQADEAEATTQQTATAEVQGQAALGGGEFVVEQGEPRVRVDIPDPSIRVDQAEPIVRVEQPTPEVTVEMPPPTVNVEQQAPLITVEQAEPIVTVVVPEPIVTIQLAEPEVAVSQADADVQVEVPQPRVQFVQPEPQIRVQQAEANVQVRQAEPQVEIERTQQADVQIEQAEPQVEVEETGEAVVNVTEAEPQVQVEQAEGAQVEVETSEPQIDVQQEEAEVEIVDAEVVEPDPAAVEELETQGFIVRSDMEETEEQRAARVEGYAPFAETRAEDLIGMNVLAADGEDVGEVDNIALMGERLMAVVGVGGFLGLGEHNVAMPLDRFTMQGDDLVINGLGSEQIENLPQYDEASAEYVPTDGRLGDLYE